MKIHSTSVIWGLRGLAGAILMLSSAVATATDAKKAVWIHTDPALGAPWREVDDAFALLLAQRHPGLRIVGVSTTFGNAGLPRTTQVARELARRFAGSDHFWPTFPGARSARDLGRRTDATEALRLAIERENSLVYIALGPLTDLATFQQLHPDHASRIAKIVVLGGRSPGRELALGPKRWPRIHDANIEKDRRAAAFVLHSGRPITLAPIEVAARLLVTPSRHWQLHRTAAGTHLARRSGTWLWFFRHVAGMKGGPVFDALPILAVADPRLMKTERRWARVDSRGHLEATDRPAAGSVEVTWIRDFHPKTHARFGELITGEPF